MSDTPGDDVPQPAPCGHRCCSDQDPFHTHYYAPQQCGGCQRQPTDVPMFDLDGEP